MDLLDPRCDEKPGRTVPTIDRNRCDAKSDCVDVSGAGAARRASAESGQT